VKLAGFGDAAAHGELVVNATTGAASLEALGLAGQANLDGKVLVDVSNPLDFSRACRRRWRWPTPTRSPSASSAPSPAPGWSKTLNTVTATVMVNPGQVGGGDHTVFVSGDDAEAKALVTGLLAEGFGWRDVVDLGDLTTARGPEMLMPLWLRLLGSLRTPMFNVKVVR
jgi:predicted dinucleotide-binding enzyme